MMNENPKMKQEKKIKQVEETYGLTKNDSKALLAEAAEVETTDVIPLDELNEYAKVDSTTTTLNNLHRDNTSTILDRNGPK